VEHIIQMATKCPAHYEMQCTPAENDQPDRHFVNICKQQKSAGAKRRQ